MSAALATASEATISEPIAMASCQPGLYWLAPWAFTLATFFLSFWSFSTPAVRSSPNASASTPRLES